MVGGVGIVGSEKAPQSGNNFAQPATIPNCNSNEFNARSSRGDNRNCRVHWHVFAGIVLYAVSLQEGSFISVNSPKTVEDSNLKL